MCGGIIISEQSCIIFSWENIGRSAQMRPKLSWVELRQTELNRTNQYIPSIRLQFWSFQDLWCQISTTDFILFLSLFIAFQSNLISVDYVPVMQLALCEQIICDSKIVLTHISYVKWNWWLVVYVVFLTVKLGAHWDTGAGHVST